MRNLALVLIIAAIIAGLFWSRAHSQLMTESRFVVKFDADSIVIMAPNGETRSVKWKDLTKVGIRTTDDGPAEPDVFWGLHTGSENAAVVFPSGATGEQEILAAMESRLPGFDDKQVIKAMGSTSNAYFLVWKRNTDRQANAADHTDKKVPPNR